MVFAKPIVMGIINATPDSFFEGHLSSGLEGIANKAEEMLAAGAEILDIGGQSTRPGSVRVSAGEEIDRVIPAITAILERFPEAVISIDTYQSEVAKAAIEAGALIVNDISGGEMDSQMIRLVGSFKCPYICMHMQGRPETMQQDPYYEDLLPTLLEYFRRKIEECNKAGIHDIILDPGFGFGKNIGHNIELLRKLKLLKIFEKPLLAGISRKSTIYKTLGTDAEGALNGTTVLNTIALMNGADILRVHDVKEAKEAVTLFSSVYAK